MDVKLVNEHLDALIEGKKVYTNTITKTFKFGTNMFFWIDYDS